MAKIDIFSEQTITGFAYNSEFGASSVNIDASVFALALGETYSVYWDGNIYECEPFEVNTGNITPIMLGNASSFGFSGNNEPFLIGWTQYGSTIYAFDEKTEHTIAIYQETPYLTLKDRKGKNVNYEGIEKVALNNTRGEQTIFSKGDTLENCGITLDFTNGDQIVEVPNGYLVKSATILKPEDAIPENILKDKNIGGIIGTAELGGGSDINQVCTFVSGDIVGLTDDSTTITIAHNLGVVPDMICVQAQKSTSDTRTMLFRLNQCSSAMFKKYGVTEGSPEINISYGLTINISNMGDVQNAIKYGYDEGNTINNVDMWGFIRDVNATHFTFGGGSFAPLRTLTDNENAENTVCYKWYAISGLSGGQE